ncbi:thiamine phosphate synthase [Anaerosporobacter faecicola]|uniref:thiamine phosphate synthase n=1 Tax=Anaerosporobacter faecicola TaxID=2718714 RepID=UPI001EE5EC0C|nr:thiamine phosphate synthase [Anaerosporobacter faecicola]
MFDERRKQLRGMKEAMLVYAVTDRSWLGKERLYDQVKKTLKGGTTILQLREKDLAEKDFLEEAIEIKDLCKQYKVPFVINDNVELAKQVDADGVHVGQDDMCVKQARTIIGPDKILGVSVQTVEQALQAQSEGADYLGVGAVFPTGTKEDAVDVPYATLQQICNTVDIPVVAIGGIKLENLGRLKKSGIAGIAVVSAIFAAADIEEATKRLVKATKKLVEQESEYENLGEIDVCGRE